VKVVAHKGVRVTRAITATSNPEEVTVARSGVAEVVQRWFGVVTKTGIRQWYIRPRCGAAEEIWKNRHTCDVSRSAA